MIAFDFWFIPIFIQSAERCYRCNQKQFLICLNNYYACKTKDELQSLLLDNAMYLLAETRRNLAQRAKLCSFTKFALAAVKFAQILAQIAGLF